MKDQIIACAVDREEWWMRNKERPSASRCEFERLNQVGAADVPKVAADVLGRSCVLCEVEQSSKRKAAANKSHAVQSGESEERRHENETPRRVTSRSSERKPTLA